MLMYGNIRALDYGTTDNCVVLNFSGFYDGPDIYRVKLIPLTFNPPEDVFEQQYWQWIFGNDTNFKEFMKIIHPLYLGQDVFLVVSEQLTNWNESLLKLIQVRYGITAVYIEEEQDLYYARDVGISSSGMSNIDTDIDRLSTLIESERIAQRVSTDKEARHATREAYEEWCRRRDSV